MIGRNAAILAIIPSTITGNNFLVDPALPYCTGELFSQAVMILAEMLIRLSREDERWTVSEPYFQIEIKREKDAQQRA